MNSNQPPILQANPTTRLRPLCVDDAELLYQLVDNNRVHLRVWLGWVDSCQSAETQRPFIASVVERGNAGRGAVWLIEHNGTACGVAGFNFIEPINRTCEIGYWLAADHQGLGIMTACTARLVQHAFEDLNLNRITIPAAVQNLRSRAIPERLRFTAEGVLRQAEWLYDHYVDHVLYALVQSDLKR